MGVVNTREIYRGRARSATFADVPTYTRVWIVTVDETDADFQEISEAPGESWLAAHPENDNAFLTDSSVQLEGDSPFHYRVTFTYKGMKPEDAEPVPTDRPAQFSFSGSLASAPAFWHFPNAGDNSTKQIIINTAGDPIGGLDRDEGEFTVNISSNEPSPFNYAKAQNYVGAINSDEWSGGQPKTWKCMSITANRKVEEVSGSQYVYYEVSATLAYRGTGWDLQTWDVGFNEIVGGQRKKILAGKDPVSEPAALSNGRAKTPGQPPDMLTFRVYKMLTFNGAFYTIPDT
jgi:hypothetical protein